MLTLQASSQKTVFSFQPASTPDLKKSFPYQSYLASDNKTGKTSIILKNSTLAEYLLLDNNLRVEEKFQAPGGLMNTIFKVESYKYLDANINTLGACYYFGVKDKTLNGGNGHIRMEVVDFKNKTVSSKMIFSIPDGQITIDWFTSEGNFFMVSVNDKTNQIFFHVVDNNGNYFSKMIPADFEWFNQYKKKKLTLSEYFSFSYVFRSDEETELIASTDLTKLYVYPGELVIVVANYKEPPHIWRFDTRNFTLTSKMRLDMSGFVGFAEKEYFYANSSVYKNNLYLLNTSKKKIEIGIFELASGKLLKKHELNESSTLPLVETPVEIISRGRSSKKNTINSNKELLKELNTGSSGIALAHNSQGQMILSCGVYDKEERTSGGYYAGGFSQSSISTGATHAGSNIPVTRTYSNFNSMTNYKNGKAYMYTRTVNFKVTIDTTTFNIIDSKEKFSSIDKVNKLLETIDKKSQAENSFKKGGKYYICYYNSDNTTFSIQEVE
jgi:hypothetical protein